MGVVATVRVGETIGVEATARGVVVVGVVVAVVVVVVVVGGGGGGSGSTDRSQPQLGGCSGGGRGANEGEIEPLLVVVAAITGVVGASMGARV